MSKKTKKITIIVIILLVVLFFVIKLNTASKNNSEALNGEISQNSSNNSEQDYLLDGYPLKEVPLYKLDRIESMKYFVNDDSNNFASPFGQPVNYYNVVFKTNASQEDFISYYRQLMSSELENYGSESSVSGFIGKYGVDASHYGSGVGYLQVYLPSEEYAKENPFFGSYPSIVVIDELFLERENSYGKLNQNGGEIEYTQYFNLITDDLPLEWEDSDPFLMLYNKYKSEYASRENFTFNDDTQTLSFKDNEYEVTLVFSSDHGRVYLMIRRPM